MMTHSAFRIPHSARARGQSTLEYATLVAIVCAVIVSMQIYAKRAVQGNLKRSADSIGPLFSPSLSNFTFTRTTHQKTRDILTERGESASTFLDHGVASTSGYVDDFSNRRLTDEPLFQ